MKNIHILPTDKPSRLYLTTKEYIFEKEYSLSTDECQNKHIYITSSDEEIKEGDWFISLYSNSIQRELKLDWTLNKDAYKKIILTTDQDLIKDGVQAIDDEFLEWFVKNPSCKFVEVRKEKYSERFDNDKSPIGNPNTWGNRWLAIIPKEEPKKVLTEEDIFNQRDIDAVTDYINRETSKQENTLEEVLGSSMCEYSVIENKLAILYRNQVKIYDAITKEQQGYSEEDMAESFMACWKANVPEGFECKLSFNEWFEQFKKK